MTSRKIQRLTSSLLLLTAVSRAILFVQVFATRLGDSLTYRIEFILLLAVSTLCALSIYLIDSLGVFLVLHALDCLAIFTMMQILLFPDFLPKILILAPFLITSAVYLKRRIAMIASAAVIIIVTTADILRLSRAPSIQDFLYIATCLLVFLIIAGFSIYMVHYRERTVAIMNQVDDLQIAVSNLSKANQAFQYYADTAEAQSKTEERNRITRELHDTVGYALTNIIMGLNASKVLLRESPPDLPQHLENTRRQAEYALLETRRVLYELRSIKDNRESGLRGIYHMCKIFQDVTNVKVVVQFGNLPWTLGEQTDKVMYRLIQEALTNSLRHGHAKNVQVHFWQTDAHTSINVSDDGYGVRQVKEGIGLTGMRERLKILGGSIALHNTETGCELIAEIPITKESERDEKNQSTNC